MEDSEWSSTQIIWKSPLTERLSCASHDVNIEIALSTRLVIDRRSDLVRSVTLCQVGTVPNLQFSLAYVPENSMLFM